MDHSSLHPPLGRWTRAVAMVFLVAGLLTAAPPPQVASAGAGASLRPDFNGDGFDDLAIGEPNATVGGEDFAGRVLVLYGSRNGLQSTGAQSWTQDTPGVPEAPASADSFGAALAFADFDGDGFGDLAVGAPGEDLPAGVGPPLDGAGVVHIIYGSASGLRATQNRFLFEIHKGTQPGQSYGHALAAVDAISPPSAGEVFEPDGRPDLAVGSPRYDTGCCPADIEDAGRVDILSSDTHGGVTGQTQTGSLGPHAGARLGASLAAGDFDGDGEDELAMGAPRATVGGDLEAGAVYFLDDSVISPDSSEIQGTSEPEDRWASSLAAGDFDGDGHDDLASGAPLEELDGGADAGLVNVIYGSSSGLGPHNNEILLQQAGSLDGEDEEGDLFGVALETADFGRGPQDDLAVGVAGEDSTGLATVVYGSPGGLGLTSAQDWTQDEQGVLGSSQEQDAFGVSFAAGRFGKGGRADLAIGVPNENAGGNPRAGAAAVLYSTRKGLTADGDQLWHADKPGVPGTALKSTQLGITLYSSADLSGL